MFEKTQWIAYSHGGNIPWYRKYYENEDCAELMNGPAYAHREYGSFVFRREFFIGETVCEAALNICGLGFYEVRINGVKPDENRVLTPLVSDYTRYIRYDRYDVTALLRKGENVIEAEVCGGWFTGKEKFWGWQQMFFGNPKLNVQLDCILNGGGAYTLGTDTENWSVSRGRVVRSCVYDGETVDLNLPCDKWKKPEKAEIPCSCLIESTAPPVRITKRIPPVSVRSLSETCFVYDFGINGAAVPYLEVRGEKNDTVRLNFSEYLNPDGTLNELSCTGGGAENTDIFTLTGNGTDICMPRFTWHGYRYCMVTLSSPRITVDRAEKCELHSDIETTGYFECSDPGLNRLHAAYAQTQISCLIGEPLDCNQRGERKGWTGDAAVSAEEAVYNFDMRKIYETFLADMKAERHPVRKTIGIICPNHKSFFDGTSIDWGLAYPAILAESYARYGDEALLKEHIGALEEYVGFYNSLRQEDGLLPDSIDDPNNGEKTSLCWFGDWCTEDKPDGQERVAFRSGPENHRQNPAFLANVFYCALLRLTAKIEKQLGNGEAYDRYTELRDQTAGSVYQKHYDREKHILGSGGQFLQTIALAEDIVPAEERNAAFGTLLKSFADAGYHSYMGIFGVRLIGCVLRDFGREDILYRILTAEGYPGMMNMIAKGQTTVAENLSGGDNDIWGSGCHCMFASPDAFLYRIFAGITIDRFGEYPVVIRPYCPKKLAFAAASQKIAEGTVSVKWERTGSGLIRFAVSVPEGIKAETHLSGTESRIDTVLGQGEYEFAI